MRITWVLVEKAIELGFTIATKIDGWRKKGKAAKGLSFKDVAHIKAQSEASAARRSSKTVRIERPPRAG